MKEIQQTSSFNCFTAALASILEVEIGEMNLPYNGVDMTPIHHTAYLRRHGLSLIHTTPGCLEDRWLNQYYIGVGVSPRDTNVMHAVVCLGRKIVWDPYKGPPQPVREILHCYFVTKLFGKEAKWTGEEKDTAPTMKNTVFPSSKPILSLPQSRASLAQTERRRREFRAKMKG